MMNETIVKFGYPATCIREWDHWVLLLRQAQPTLGSCILAARGDATAFGNLAATAYAELATVTPQIEAALSDATGYAKINYLMLMMVDPHVHFHVIPRYKGSRDWQDVSFTDAGWPNAPGLGTATPLLPQQIEQMTTWLSAYFPLPSV